MGVTLFTKPALAMAKVGITPNMLTVTGTVLSVVVAVCTLPQGHFLLGVGLLLIVLFGDSFDGILARATGTSSPFGAFLDSCLDRLTDAAVFDSVGGPAHACRHPAHLDSVFRSGLCGTGSLRFLCACPRRIGGG